MNVTVYLASNFGNDKIYENAIRELGNWIGESNNVLIYGGSKSGLMGALAESTLDAGGKVIGIEPQIFIDQGYLYDRIDELIVTKDMPERKTKMIEYGDVFIAFPGGTGTLEEVSEVMSLLALGHLDSDCILYNLNGYYEPIREMLFKMVENDFSSNEKLKNIYFANNLEDIKNIINGR